MLETRASLELLLLLCCWCLARHLFKSEVTCQAVKYIDAVNLFQGHQISHSVPRLVLADPGSASGEFISMAGPRLDHSIHTEIDECC